MYVRAGVVCVVVCRTRVVNEHTDVDDGRRLGVSGVERGWPSGHARRISRRVGVWVVGKRKKRPVVGTAHDTENLRRLNETFYVGSFGFRLVSLI